MFVNEVMKVTRGTISSSLRIFMGVLTMNDV